MSHFILFLYILYYIFNKIKLTTLLWISIALSLWISYNHSQLLHTVAYIWLFRKFGLIRITMFNLWTLQHRWSSLYCLFTLCVVNQCEMRHLNTMWIDHCSYQAIRTSSLITSMDPQWSPCPSTNSLTTTRWCCFDMCRDKLGTSTVSGVSASHRTAHMDLPIWLTESFVGPIMIQWQKIRRCMIGLKPSLGFLNSPKLG